MNKYFKGCTGFFISAILLTAYLLFPYAANAGSISIQDDLGRTITLNKPAQRIIALYGAFNEILAAMEKTDKLVARTNADSTPSAVAKLPSIGTHMRPNTELVAGLHPDLVLQMGGRKKAQETTRAIERLGIPVAFFSVSTFTELYSVIKRLGILTGDTETATRLTQALSLRLEAVTRKLKTLQNVQTPSVFFEVRYPNLLGAGQGSIVTDVIHHAGGINILGPEYGNRKFVRANEEELLRKNPDYYIIQRGPMNPAPIELTQRPHYALLNAVTSKQYMTVNEHIFSRPGPRAVDAVEQLAKFLHPHLFTENK